MEGSQGLPGASRWLRWVAEVTDNEGIASSLRTKLEAQKFSACTKSYKDRHDRKFKNGAR